MIYSIRVHDCHSQNCWKQASLSEGIGSNGIRYIWYRTISTAFKLHNGQGGKRRATNQCSYTHSNIFQGLRGLGLQSQLDSLERSLRHLHIIMIGMTDMILHYFIFYLLHRRCETLFKFSFDILMNTYATVDLNNKVFSSVCYAPFVISI